MADNALHGLVAVVTGGGRGIGAAIAKQLAAIGATVAICGRSPQPLLQTAQSITAAGGSALTVACDVTKMPSVQEAAAKIISEYARHTSSAVVRQ